VDGQQRPDCVTWLLVNEFVRVSPSVLLNLVFELNFLNVFMGQEHSMEFEIWFIHVFVLCFVILSMFNVLLG
jgi:hypothetical protein